MTYQITEEQRQQLMDGFISGDTLKYVPALKLLQSLAPVEQACYCNDNVSLQMVSGGGAPEGYLGKVTLRIGDKYRDYYTHEAAPVDAKPVAWQVKYKTPEGWPQIAWFPHPVHPDSPLAKLKYTEEPLYAHPAPLDVSQTSLRELSDSEIAELADEADVESALGDWNRYFARAVLKAAR